MRTAFVLEGRLRFIKVKYFKLSQNMFGLDVGLAILSVPQKLPQDDGR